MRARGKAVFVAESMLFDSKGREIARGSGNFVKSKIKISPETGYNIGN
jgi:hypothetical protein